MHLLLPGGGTCGALPVALARLAWEWWGCASARFGAPWTGAGDLRQMMSVGPAGRWGVHSLGPHPRGRRLAVLLGVACGCGARIRQGSLLPGAGLASRPSSPGREGCLGSSAVRMVGAGFSVCQRGNPHRMVAPGGVSGSHGLLFALQAPQPLKTVVAGVSRRVPGSPGTQGWPRCCAFAWLQGCRGPRVGAIASVAPSFHRGYRSPYAP